MDCDHFLEQMSAALDGECTPQERLALERHLAVCPECAARFEILSDNTRALRELECDMPADLKERILGALPAREASPRSGKVLFWKRWAPAAAAACLVLVLALAPALRTADSPDLLQNDAAPNSVELPQTAKSGETVYDNSSSVAEEAVPGESDRYFLSDPQVIRVSCGSDPAPVPGARILGSTGSLTDYLSGIRGYDEEMQEALDALSGSCTEEFFRTGRLLCVVVEAGSGSIRYELVADGLSRSRVTVREEVPAWGTDDMAVWLLVAEVDCIFNDGDILDIDLIR